MKYLGVVLIALAGAFALAEQDTQNGQAAQNDRFLGTWKLNVAKSKFSPGPAAKAETVTIAQDKVSVRRRLRTVKRQTGPIRPHREPQQRSPGLRTRA